MLSIFRINDPSRAFFLLGLAALLRVPFLLVEIEPLHEQVLWINLGEKFLDGSRLYSEIWTTHPPLFAWLSSLFFLVFSSSVVGQVLGSTVIVWISAYQFNSLLADIEAFKSKNYIPGAIFVLLSTASFEFLAISPQLLATPFLIGSLRFTLPMLRGGMNFNQVFFSGLLLSVASAIFLPTTYLIPFFCFSFF